jgi:hypothetical protein
MVFAHIFGIPVEETALTFAPVIVVVIAGVRPYGQRARRKLRADAQRVTSKPTVERNVAQPHR